MAVALNADVEAGRIAWPVVVAAMLTALLEVLDLTVVNVSLPHMLGAFGATPDQITWVVTSYMISSAAIMPLTGYLVTNYGRRTTLLFSIGGFVVTSAACGAAWNLQSMVIFRLLQGATGAVLIPLAQSFLFEAFPREKRAQAMSIFGLSIMIAPILGPTLGGWITDNYEWRWVFLINIPVGAAALWLSSRYITDPPFLKRRFGVERRGGDFIGLGLFAVGLGAMQIALDLGEREDWFDSNLIRGAAIVSAVGLVAGVARAFAHRQPMIDFRVLRDRNLALACVYMLVFGGVLYGTTALLPLMMQTQLGYTAQLSGLVLSPGGLVIALLMPFVGWAVGRTDARRMIVWGVLVVSLSLWWMAHLTLDVDFATLVYARMLQGFGLAFIFVPINTIAYATVPAVQRNAASSLISIARNVGGAIGIGYTSTMVARLTQEHRISLGAHATADSPQFTAAVDALRGGFVASGVDAPHAGDMALAVMDQAVERQAAMLSYLDQFRVLAVVFLVLVPVVMLMRRPRAHRPVPVKVAVE